MPENTVSIIIEAQDEASAVLATIAESVSGLGEQAQVIADEMAGAFDSVGDVSGVYELKTEFGEIQDRLGGLTEGSGEWRVALMDAANVAGEIAAAMERTAGGATGVSERYTAIAASMREAAVGARDMDEGTRQASSGVGSLSDQLRGYMGVAKAAAGLWGASRLIEQTLAFGEAGAQLINLQRGFDNAAEAAGSSGDAMLSSMMDVGRGILDNDFLMREFILTTRMAGTEIAGDWPQLMKVALASVAEGVGDAEGNLQRLDQYIRTGFGRGVKMEMGLQIPDAGPLMDAYAASLGTTADRLTESQQAQARLNAVLEAGRAQFGDLDKASSELAGGGITRLRNEFGNLIEFLQIAVAPTIDDVAGRLATFFSRGVSMNTVGTDQFNTRMLEMIAASEAATGPVKDLDDAWAAVTSTAWMAQEILRQIIVPGGPGVDAITADVADLAAYFDIASMSEEEFAGLLAQVRAVSAEAATALKANYDALTRVAQAAEYGAGAVARFMGATRTATSGADGFRDSILGVVSAMGGLDAGVIRGLKVRPLEDQEPQRKLYETSVDYLVALDQYRADQHDEAVARMEKADADMASASASNLSAMQANMESYASSYESAAAGLLSPSGGGPSVDEMLAATGQRQEAWDESMRRAQAVFEDYGNTAKQSWFAGWAEQVGFPVGATEDEARAWAARYAQEFSLNMHPEDVNYAATTTGMQDIITANLGQQDIMAQMQQGFIGAGIGMDSPEVMAAFNWAGAGAQGGNEMAGAFIPALVQQDWAGAAIQVSTKFRTGLVKQPALLESLAGDLWPYMKRLGIEDGGR